MRRTATAVKIYNIKLYGRQNMYKHKYYNGFYHKLSILTLGAFDVDTVVLELNRI